MKTICCELNVLYVSSTCTIDELSSQLRDHSLCLTTYELKSFICVPINCGWCELGMAIDGLTISRVETSPSQLRVEHILFRSLIEMPIVCVALMNDIQSNVSFSIDLSRKLENSFNFNIKELIFSDLMDT